MSTLLITGASAGIGAACARLAARPGLHLALHYNRDAAGAQAVAEAARAEGAGTTCLQADLGDPDQIDALFARLDADCPPLTGLINNAGIVDVTARVDEMDAARLSRMFQVNVIGAILVAGSAVGRMSTRHGGTGGAIVNVSSAAARLGSPGQYVDYAASKGAIDTFTRGLALEVAGEGLRVNAVRPGIIETGIHARGGLPDRARDLAPTVPLARPGTPEEVARAILHLLSDEASYTTGAILDISGGR
ncbi:short-chain dehydrogenase/reductase SDR [Dinoroseobacter shibae DFL 12 = DSM 16493]|jgi:NAD(P)-dependent dehydrogenase (short-subunit alcohol dehydrogenase family)|uniref:Short-chain dehydrogenase/reductase SDR n=1 Tax=Dinoroseobacter shibae (strain DSM 16493 / NCIMB 14021 / DFL 12) TaxID=398580 RepID=A8LIB0_DINSH|nr:SDR family oxidoreductase [Dinoroseobacter shibae]ABV92964.1 short-chain dehydrogenase/reductase SDR [Dinoroseobacter shibae DFL 12 = DSM 16493]URF47898.1 SDR family oxidoreductase [Dinoroseobacter shibae]URF52207.1 SDR family oxidoreductase [Dinoroseobacter shibae]